MVHGQHHRALSLPPPPTQATASILSTTPAPFMHPDLELKLDKILGAVQKPSFLSTSSASSSSGSRAGMDVHEWYMDEPNRQCTIDASTTTDATMANTAVIDSPLDMLTYMAHQTNAYVDAAIAAAVARTETILIDARLLPPVSTSTVCSELLSSELPKDCGEVRHLDQCAADQAPMEEAIDCVMNKLVDLARLVTVCDDISVGTCIEFAADAIYDPVEVDMTEYEDKFDLQTLMPITMPRWISWMDRTFCPPTS